MIKKDSGLGAIAIILAASLWGLDGVILRPSLYSLNVPVAVFLEHVIAFTIMITVFFGSMLFIKNGKKDIKKLSTLNIKDWSVFFWIALFGGAIGTMAITKALFLVGFNHLSAIIILQKLQPLFAVITAMILLKERPSTKFFGIAAIAIIGSYLITFGFHRPEFGEESLFLAASLSLLAAFSWGSSTAFGKKAVEKAGFKLSTIIRFGLTSLIMIMIITATQKFGEFNAVGLDQYKTLIIIALTTGGAAIFIYYWGLRRIMASRATIYELGFPVTAVILDYVVNGHIMNAGQWLGTFLVIASMTTLSRLKNGK